MATARADNFETTTMTEENDGSLEFPQLDIWYIVIIHIVAVLAIVGNSMTLAAIFKNEKLQTTTNVYVGSLAVADLLVGIIIPLLTILGGLFHVGLTLLSDVLFCTLYNVFYMFPMFCSAYHFMYIANDRHYAVVYPFKYNSTTSKSRTVFNLAVIWITALVTAVNPLFSINSKDTSHGKCDTKFVEKWYFLPAVAGPIFVHTVLASIFYGRIFVIAWKQNKKIHAAHVQGQNTKRISIRDLKAVKTLSITAGAFLLCWLPYLIYCTTILFGDSSVSMPVYYLVFSLALSNSCMNVIIYAAWNQEFRKTFLSFRWCAWLKTKLSLVCLVENKAVTEYQTDMSHVSD